MTNERLIDSIDQHREEIVEFLQKLVQFNTEVSEYGRIGNEGEAQEFIADYFKKMNLEVNVFEPDNKRIRKYFGFMPGHIYKDRPNVVGTLKGKGKGCSLILNAHMDTVPAGSVSEWKHDPFGGETENGRIYGRGVVDDKGGLTAAIMAVKAVRDTGISLGGDIILESVVDEEGEGNGTLSCCDRGYRADAAIVVDSIDPITDVWVAHPGVTVFRLKVKGKPGHYCLKYTPQQGISAIDKMRVILDGLDKFQTERLAYIRDREYFPRVPIIGVDKICGGEYRAVFPESCYIEAGFDYFSSEIGEKHDDSLIREKIEERIRKIEQADNWLRENPSSIEWLASILPVIIDKQHSIVRVLKDNIEKIAGCANLVPGKTTNDARHLFHITNVPVISWSCGGQAIHGIDESIEIEDLIKATKILALAIKDWCGGK